jgi:signal transduction histidine kinase
MLLIYFIGVEYYLSKNGSLFSVSSSVFFIIVFSLIATFGLHRYNDFKEKEKRKLTAIKLAAERDPVAEYLFVETERHIKRDDSIQKYLRLLPDEENKIVKRLQHHIFTGYWSKYDLQVTLCRATDSLLIKPDNFKTGCDDFFNRMISNIGQPTALTEDLYYLNNGSGRNSYLATIRFSPDSTDNTPATTMYIELDAKFIPKELGYPELLIDKDSRVNKDVSNYSYAKYKNDSMITQYGKYFYSLNAKSYKNINDEFTFFTLDGYNHLYYKVDKSNSLIISKKQEDLLDMIAPFSYLFAFFLLVVLVVFLIVFSPINIKDLYLSFKGRLQVAMISIVLFSFIFIGATTVYYIMTVYRNKNIDNISEKAHSVLVEMENKLSDYDQLTPEMKEYLTELLTKFSNVFFTDINLYDLSGDLISSSRNKIFHEGLVSRKMNPTAFNELSVNEKTLYIHDENIGNLNYISVYIPFRNNQNKVIGYINVPYFAKQSELKKEISTFLVAFLNIYVLLIALAIIFALLISNYIARPLKFIRDKLSQIKLGKPNEKIDWNKKDELGALINEYNRMIDELSKSAKLLAESERESAWSEMAKQVAHEIKNPLTPMKLSVQHLQKAWNEKAPDWEERLERFTQTMTEQIESLSSIASEFSDFAKISKTKTEKINLVKIIETSMSLYEDYHHIIISFTKSAPHLFVNADKTQLLRVFNNLLKNSVQAIGNKEEGKIDISVIMEQKNYLIIITDNGSGISTEKTDKIFTPNFTTKTGGMGLGLAMVKSIIESTGGKIWFESEENIGTSFYITLPLYDDNEIN